MLIRNKQKYKRETVAVTCYRDVDQPQRLQHSVGHPKGKCLHPRTQLWRQKKIS